MNLDELKAQWRKDEGEPLDPPGVEDLIARTSTRLPLRLRRRLAFDLGLKALAVLSLGGVAWFVRRDAVALSLALGGLLIGGFTFGPVVRARRALVLPQDQDLRSSTQALVTVFSQFLRWPLLAVATTGSLLVLAYLLAYFTHEYGAFRLTRPTQWLGTPLCLAAPFVLTAVVLRAQVGSALESLEACLADWDPETLKRVRTQDRRTQWLVLAVGLGLALVLLLGIFVAWAGA